MAGDWIPITAELPRKREVMLLSATPGIRGGRREVVGILTEFWLWVQSESADGSLPGITLGQLPAIIEGTRPEFWRTLCDAGWIEQREGALFVPNARRWITKGAKARLQKNRRQEKWRDGDVDGGPSTHVDAEVDAGAPRSPSRKASTTVERERENRTSTDVTVLQESNGRVPADRVRSDARLGPFIQDTDLLLHQLREAFPGVDLEQAVDDVIAYLDAGNTMNTTPDRFLRGWVARDRERYCGRRSSRAAATTAGEKSLENLGRVARQLGVAAT